MKTTLMALAGAATIALGLGATTTASAHGPGHGHKHDHRGDVVERYCRDNNGDGECDHYRRNRASWDDRRYNDFYSSRREAIRAFYARERERARWQDEDADVVFKFKL